MTNLSVRLPEDVRDRVDALARATRRSRSFIINEAVVSYLESQTDFVLGIEQGLASMAAGQGHSSEQVFAWIDDWAAGNKKPIPEPDYKSKQR